MAAGMAPARCGRRGMADERPDRGQVAITADADVLVFHGAFLHGAIVTRGRFTLT